MNLGELLQEPQELAVAATGICEDSRQVRQDDIFVAVSPDLAARSLHIEQAIAAGAAAVLVPDDAVLSSAVPTLVVQDLSAQRSAIAARFYQQPSQQLCCLGVTGTNGKTSIAFHLADLSQRLGINSGYCGTLGWGELKNLQPTQLTTPNAIAVQRYLAAMRDQGASRVAMEVSSHALDQDRVAGVQFDVAIFSNLTRDHLDYHKTSEAYKAAKAKLFQQWPLTSAIINSDDAVGRELLCTARAQEVISYGKHGDVSWQSEVVRRGMRVKFATPWGSADATIPVAAEFAVANVAAAVAALLSVGHSLYDVADALPDMTPVPGRMQVLGGDAKHPRVVVDYAHTPDALEKALAALRPQCRGKLICLIGCGGDRDRGKRPQMGLAAAIGSDITWFTADNPRSEDPLAIVHDMAASLPAAKVAAIRQQVDRAEAITAAIDAAAPDDIVLIAGKGHEQTQEIDGEFLAFSDLAIVRELLSEKS